jgi:hypothetical protein
LQQKLISKELMIGGINVFYDPIVQEWKAWYTSNDLKAIFLDVNYYAQSKEASVSPG